MEPSPLPATPTATPLPATPTATPVPPLARVLRTYPIDRERDIAADVPLCIVFDQPMDTTPGSVRFSLSPEQPLRAAWPAPDRLELRGGHWQPGIVYQLTLQAARSRRGGRLAGALSLTFTRGGSGAPIPILMYHYVQRIQGDPGRYGKDCSVSPEEFAAQLDLIGELGGHVVPLGSAVEYLAHGAPLPPRPLVLTFDDTGTNVYRVVAPILRERGLTATLFVIAGFVGSGSRHYTGWEELRALAGQGFTLGSHSYSHPYCNSLSPGTAAQELAGSRQMIAAETGSEPQFFAYPYGVYSAATIAQLAECGYQAALAIGPSVYQSRSRLMGLSRIFMAYGDPLDKLRRYLLAWEAPLSGQ
ncbi:MAG TPA: polysaccharide deacetylase family protein [Anaerolineae bacterium]|nr:polysaccharide deacetylase family protein [Anaerolineae bacterium]HOQ99254.1 polysaccharide deacetylase family protein [Anaerolineae bacterium]HPL30813.1 polysaccharide deacetylase family protein [Anaerolineae bacterium]